MGKKSFLNNRILKMLLVISACIGINVAGSRLMDVTDCPLYLDCIGTVVAAAMCGYLPGIGVGIFTNLIKSLFDVSSVYYSIINALIAILVYFFAKKGFLKKIAGILGLIVSMALIGVGYELMFTRIMEGSISDVPVLEYLLIELGDKSVTVLILVLLLWLLPKKAQKFLRCEGWQQNPLSEEVTKIVRKGKSRGLSLRMKLVIVLTLVFVLMGIAAMSISVLLYRSYTIDEHRELAEGTSKLVAELIDGDLVDDYLERGYDVPGYKEAETRLYKILEQNKEIAYLYVYKILPDGCHVVLDVDTPNVPSEPPGTVTEFDESFAEERPKLLAGEPIDAKVTEDSYGWLVTSYVPVKNSAGETVCYAITDVTMETISAKEMNFLSRLALIFVSFLVLAIAIGLWVSEYDIIIPINSMALSASKFAYDEEDSLEENVERIRGLDIHTGDEIENMYRALTKTTEDSGHYVSALRTKTETIEQMQNALIMILADMVESRDETTGDHVRKTAAYTRIIMDKMKEMGYYTDQLTDQFIYDVEHSAPLHDIGKIAVSDVILNKPGKLTPEEFSIMKTHTTAGAQMIDQVIATVPDSGYLKEAKNLAEYHHEKWNGQGYPHGLAGEAIPLSARIMAVADVFDALVSRRCYKDAFSFEKAMDIIRQDAGSHFDPKVAEAFLASEAEVRQVAEHFTVYKADREVGMTEQLRSELEAEMTGKLRGK